MAQLTKTFMDAIEISQKLGLRYLWIDSLCIIQDSDSDWKKESAMMSSVYRGSAINIAAAGAADGSHGCFLKADERIEVVSTDALDGGAWKFTSPYMFRDSVIYSPLAKRGWALQERILAPRTLYFTRAGMFWECREQDCCEIFPQKLPSHEMNKRHVYHINKRAISTSWNAIIQLYTRAALTVKEDKLVAIMGIARAAQEENNDQYLAGLWRQNMEEQLCWGISGKSPMRQDDAAPSWSWASVSGEVWWSIRFEKDNVLLSYFAHVRDANVTLNGPDPFGRVSGGSLTISCVGTFIANSSDTIIGPIDLQDFKIRFHWDGENQHGSTCILLPLFHEKRFYDFCWGLCLQPTNNCKGEYQRVGYFDIPHYSPGNLDHSYRFDRFRNFLREHGNAIAESAYAYTLDNPEHEDERFVITIV
ncbi:MAG: hypothetical protein Q9227_000429 [Pyrenula ochraceoflavens]